MNLGIAIVVVLLSQIVLYISPSLLPAEQNSVFVVVWSNFGKGEAERKEKDAARNHWSQLEDYYK